MRRLGCAGAAIWVMGLGGCARQAPPPGGPADQTPPTLVASQPVSGSVAVPCSAPVTIHFSEAMQRAEVERALDIFPAPASPPELKWSGSRLVILPDTIWEEDRTYIITIQAEASDRRGNRLGRSHQIAFSTGTEIDSGTIVGRILRAGRGAPGALALCYRIVARSPNPERDSADYVVAADSGGGFRFDFLSPGTYRVFGLDDRDRDRLWNVGVEALAVPSGDLELRLRGDAAELPPLALVTADTVRPSVVDCRLIGGAFVELNFDRPLDSADLETATVRMLGRGQVTVARRLFLPDSVSARLFAELAEPPDTGSWSLVMSLAHRGTGRVGEDTCLLTAGEDPGAGRAATLARVRPDTLRTSAQWWPLVDFQFTDPIARLTVARLVLTQSGRAQSVEWSLPNPFTARLQLTEAYSGRIYLEIPQGAVLFAAGGAWPLDSPLSVAIPLPHSDSAGSFELHLALDPPPGSAIYRLGLLPVTGSTQLLWRDLEGPGPLSGRLLSGSYRMLLLLDRDLNHRRDAGWPFPFRPSEPAWEYPDTLQVRARFTTELRLPPPSKK